MSNFIEHEHTFNDFRNSEPWIILRPIEKDIKRKIELIGIPLNKWNININYGIKTGCNEAFIINTDLKNEIIRNCSSEEERIRTLELIRPILRGRDIKRYNYEWADLWLIAIFPSKKYNIDQYPAVKKHLLTFAKNTLIKSNNQSVAKNHLEEFCYKKLLQAGKTIEIEGEKIYIDKSPEKSRKSTKNEWFETQDSISYWEDFNNPKIVYMEIQTDNPSEGYPFPCFSYDSSNAIALNTAYIMCSNDVDVRYILGILNSSLGGFLVKLYVTQLQQRQYRMLAQYVTKFPIVKSDSKTYSRIIDLVSQNLKEPCVDVENEIDNLVFDLYNLTEDEIQFIRDRES